MAQEIAVEKTNGVIVHQEQSGGGFLAIIEQHIADPNFTTEKLHSLIDANERILNKQAEIEFNRDRAIMQADIPPIEEKHWNPQTRSWYADITDITSIVNPNLKNHGFSLSFKEIYTGEMVTSKALLLHRSGHMDSNDCEMPFDKTGAKGTINKTDIHARASSVTYARRYAVTGLLSLTFYNKNGKSNSLDDDGNLGGSKLIAAQQVEILRKWIDDTGADIKKFCEHFDIPSITEMAARDYQKATDLLKAKETQAKAKTKVPEEE